MCTIVFCFRRKFVVCVGNNKSCGTKFIITNTWISFLGIAITKNNNTNRIETNMYRNPTFNPNIVSNNSYHPKQYKLAAFRSQMNRAFTHCSTDENLNNELWWIVSFGRKFVYEANTIKTHYKYTKCKYNSYRKGR